MLGLIRDAVLSFFQTFTEKAVITPAAPPPITTREPKAVITPAAPPPITTREPKAEFVPPAPMKREPYNLRVRRPVSYAETEGSGEEELR
jgi:hypothetical protein